MGSKRTMLRGKGGVQGIAGCRFIQQLSQEEKVFPAGISHPIPWPPWLLAALAMGQEPTLSLAAQVSPSWSTFGEASHAQS